MKANAYDSAEARGAAKTRGTTRRASTWVAFSAAFVLAACVQSGAPGTSTAAETVAQTNDGDIPDRLLLGTWKMTYKNGSKCDVQISNRNPSGIGRMTTTRCEGLPLAVQWRRNGDRIRLFDNQSAKGEPVGRLTIIDCNEMEGSVRGEGRITLRAFGQKTRCE